jgi:diguanylate cyclase (GGDEF)-like protein
MRAAPLPSARPRPAAFGDTAEALHAVRLLLEATSADDGPMSLPDRVAAEARQFFRMSRAVLLRVAGASRRVQLCAMDPPAPRRAHGLIPLAKLDPIADLQVSDAARCLVGPEAAELSTALGLVEEAGTLLLLPIHVNRAMNHVLLLASPGQLEFSEGQLDIAEAFAAAVGAGLSRFHMARANATEASREAALSRAAKALNSSLDLNRVLVRICEESARILGAHTAIVYLGDKDDGLRIEAGSGVGPEVIGVRIRPGEGLAGRVMQTGEPMLTNDHQSLSGIPAMYAEVKSALAVPLRWNGDLHGVLSLGWKHARMLRRDHLTLLEGFGEIAATACGNASTHEGLVTAARTDALTGCLNQAALHDTLRRELDRCRRTDQKLSLAIVDLDDFKQVNERHGHLAGDEVLRRVGRALRRAVRPYDVVGRYGGDEFAIIAGGTEESGAREMAARAIERVARSVEELELSDTSARATAGVAEWQPGESPTELIGRADHALLYGKHEGARGTALPASALPPDYQPSGGELAIRIQAVADMPQAALSESR